MLDSSPRLLYWPKQRQISQMTAFNSSRCFWEKLEGSILKNDSVAALFSREAAFEATSSRTPTSRKLKRMYVVKHTGCNVTNFFCTQNHLVS